MCLAQQDNMSPKWQDGMRHFEEKATRICDRSPWPLFLFRLRVRRSMSTVDQTALDVSILVCNVEGPEGPVTFPRGFALLATGYSPL
jgi:hypothetical protein